MSNFYDGLGQGMALSNAHSSKNLDTESRNLAGTQAVRDALVKALADVAPNHPLLNKDERNKIFYKASGFKP